MLEGVGMVLCLFSIMRIFGYKSLQFNNILKLPNRASFYLVNSRLFEVPGRPLVIVLYHVKSRTFKVPGRPLVIVLYHVKSCTFKVPGRLLVIVLYHVKSCTFKVPGRLLVIVLYHVKSCTFKVPGRLIVIVLHVACMAKLDSTLNGHPPQCPTVQVAKIENKLSLINQSHNNPKKEDVLSHSAVYKTVCVQYNLYICLKVSSVFQMSLVCIVQA